MNEQKDHPYQDNLNPFTAIWLRSRETARYAIEEKPLSYIMLIIAIAGISSTLTSLFDSEQNFGLSWIGIILLGLIISPIGSLIGVSIVSAIYFVFGKLFKGTSTYAEMFKAVGVTLIPQIWLIPLLLIGLAISPDFFSATAVESASGFEAFLSFFIYAVLAIVGIWVIVIQSQAVGEAHRISSWKGFFTIFIPGVLFALVIIVVIVLFAMFFMSFS